MRDEEGKRGMEVILMDREYNHGSSQNKLMIFVLFERGEAIDK